MIPSQAVEDRFDFRLRGRGLDTILQPAERPEHPGIPPRRRQAGHLCERQPRLGGARHARTVGHDADHGNRRAVDANRSPDEVRRAGIPGLPQTFSDQHHGRGAGAIVLGQEAAAGDGLHPDDAERGRCEIGRVDPLGSVALVPDGNRRVRERAEAGERLR